MGEESQGTIYLYEIAGGLLKILNKGGVLIVDEINNGLHPLVSRMIVSLFNNPDINKNNAQLIITTHDTTLLSNKIFRRDQIWFAEKKNSATQIYSMADFDYSKVRNNIPYDKWYLSDRFGALPNIQDTDFVKLDDLNYEK